MSFILDLAPYLFMMCLLSSSTKAMASQKLMPNDGKEIRQSPHFSPSDKLSNGCNLPDAINLLMCSASSNQESFNSAVHYPTKLIISQLGHELSLGSISNPQAVEKVSNAIRALNTVLKDDQSFSSISNSPNLVSSSTTEQVINSMTELIRNHGKSEKLQRQAVQTLSSMARQSSVPHEVTNSNPVLEAPVLERPPLASAIDPVAINQDGHPQQLLQTVDVGPVNQQNSREIRETSNFALSNSHIQDCAVTSLVPNSCSPMEVQNVLRTFLFTFATAITNVKDARNVLLNNVVEAPACSAPGVTGNQLGWASLGTSERSLVNIMSALLKADKVATEKLKHDNENNDNENDLSTFAHSINEVLPGASNLLLSTMDQLSSTSKSMNKNSMNGFMKSLNDGQKTMKGFFGGIFGG